VPAEETLVAQATPQVQEPAAPAASAPRSLDGTVTDRFGAPLSSERVWLLPAGSGHPPAGTNLTDYVTARTSRSGNFSLSLPTAGPWSLGVGEAGAPRVPPSKPRTLQAAAHADVFVPGSAGLRVSFASLPEGPVSLELMTLREPGDAGGAQRGNFGARPGGQDGGGRGRGRGQRSGGQNGEQGSGDQGGERRGGGQVLLAPAPAERPALASLAQDADVQDPPNGGRRRGYRGPGDTSPGTAPGPSGAPQQPDASRRGNRQDGQEPELPVGPPEEIWRSVKRVTIRDEDRAAGFVRFEGVPVGWVGRIDLVIDRQRYEGSSRFALQADALTEVKLFPFEPMPGAALVYSAISRPLGTTESPPGVHFRD
jgi:hypothetical protein